MYRTRTCRRWNTAMAHPDDPRPGSVSPRCRLHPPHQRSDVPALREAWEVADPLPRYAGRCGRDRTQGCGAEPHESRDAEERCPTVTAACYRLAPGVKDVEHA